MRLRCPVTTKQLDASIYLVLAPYPSPCPNMGGPNMGVLIRAPAVFVHCPVRTKSLMSPQHSFHSPPILGGAEIVTSHTLPPRCYLPVSFDLHVKGTNLTVQTLASHECKHCIPRNELRECGENLLALAARQGVVRSCLPAKSRIRLCMG